MGNCLANAQNIDYNDEFILPASIEQSTPKRQRQQLLDILKHPQLTILFREYLRSIFCIEGYAFFMDCEEFRQLTDEADMKAKATEIFNKYFTSDCEYEINIEGALIEMLKEATERPDKETFDLVEQLVLVTMEGTCLTPFLNWRLYQDFIQDPVTRKVFLTGVSRTPSFYQIQRYTEHVSKTTQKNQQMTQQFQQQQTRVC